MLRLIRELFFRKKRNNIFSVSQRWLGTRCGATREWINKLLKQLEEQSIIKILYIHKKKSFYRVSSFFTDTIIASLSHLWRAWPLALLASNPALDAVKIKSSQLLNEDIYIKTSNQLKQPVTESYKHVRAREETGQLTSNQFKKQEIQKKDKVAMQADLYSSVFIPITKNLKSIRVTVWGQIRLSCYPEAAILYADAELLKTNKQLTNRFKYFCGIADSFCKENELPVDWSGMFRLARENGMPDLGPFYDPEFVPVKLVVQKTSKKTTGFNPGKHNQEIIDRLGTPQLKQKPKKMTHEEEWEWTRINDPVKFARWEANARQFRAMMGLNEDGTFQPGRSPHEAVDILLQLNNN